MHAFKLTRIGSKLGIVLPDEIVQRQGLKEGDKVYLEILDDGSMPVTTDAEIFSAFPGMMEQLRAGQEFMRDYHAAFRMLDR